MPTQTNDFWRLYKPKSCSISLKSTSQEGVFEEIVENLVHGKSLPEERAKDAVAALVEREAMASTGLGVNVAIPHVKLKGLEQAAVSLSVHKDGLEWKALDGEPVHLFFTVLRPEKAGELHDPDRHLEMMQWISRLTRDADFRRFAIDAKTKKELVDLLKEKASL